MKNEFFSLILILLLLNTLTPSSLAQDVEKISDKSQAMTQKGFDRDDALQMVKKFRKALDAFFMENKELFAFIGEFQEAFEANDQARMTELVKRSELLERKKWGQACDIWKSWVRCNRGT